MDNSGSNVSELIRLARQHEPAAMDRLLDAYRNYLSMMARLWIESSLHGKVDPSDLVQETLLKAHERFPQFHGTTEPELAGWLRRILARNVVDVVRRYQVAARRLSREHSLDPVLNDSVQAVQGLVAASGTSPSRAAERRELGVILADALAGLSDDRAEVVVLRNLQQLEWEEIARRMQRSVDAVRMLWTRALKELRPRIEAAQ